jgi:Fur family zinc uptake transcriptional regulator
MSGDIGGTEKERKPRRNQELVLGALMRAEKPLRAYDLLGMLHGHGLQSPLQIYRALDRLIAEGKVHKIESLSAFALCAHHDCGVKRHAVFTICVNCGQASEVRDAALDRALRGLARRHRFRTQSTAVELSGLCEACADG